jgi:hypothetical protein
LRIELWHLIAESGVPEVAQMAVLGTFFERLSTAVHGRAE